MSTFLLLLAAVFCMGSGSVLTFGVLIARHRRYQERQRAALMAHIERHPAGKALTFPFRARPCQHLLYASSLDEVPHVELLHVEKCTVVSQLPNRKKAA